MSKFTKPTLSLKQFMLRQEVIKLYREIFRSIKLVPEVSSRNDLKQWTRSDFRANMHHTDELTIKMLLQHGQRSLKELQTSLELSGITPASEATSTKNTKSNDKTK
ncbi:LYR motif-containing protein 2 [Sitodiplosis mosellana]|uniref:LYR motif-containing protein 2 n=1 Tax=Sitodiplosis mosellana TaxID=263140 RepID=UPI002443B063|nr:LYR motif-containing protein 2 [Sitodiplosis mosellana]